MGFTITLRGTSCQQCQGLQWTGSYCFISSQREDSRVSFPTDRLLLHIMLSILAWPLHARDYCELLLANFAGCSLDKDIAPQSFRVSRCTQRQFQLFQAIWTIWAWQPLLWILLFPSKPRTLFCCAWWQAHRHWFSKSLEHVR